MTSIPYRTEIDGLRAIAVLAVVLYHARLGPSAGYVGVDIFFVISGYLITALLYKEWIADGRISLLGFYARRVRRLFAALAVVVAATVGASWFLLSPFGEQRQLAQSAAASLVFVGNLYFQTHTGGYFSGTSDLLPLLHLWSLGVEEQFYLLWPMLLILVLRLRPKWLYPAVLMTSLASLAVAEILIRDNPQAAFYQMPARFWELGIGGLIALRPAGRLLDGRAPAYAALVVMAVAVSVPFTHFPGLGALPAVASAALLLYAVHGSDELGLIGTFLRSRAMVFFGLISYSLYLWHWPLLAVDRVMRIGGSPLGVRAGLVLVAILLAWLSYRFVEQPFRRADLKATPTKIVTAAVLAYVSLAYCSLVIGDFLYRVPIPNDLASRSARDWPENRTVCNYRGDEDLSVFPKPNCNSVANKPVRVAIWGDSHALAWQPFAWALAARQGAAATSFTRDSCPPVLDLDNGKRFLEAKRCRDFNQLVIGKVNGLDVLILTALWPQTSADNPLPATEYAAKFAATVERVAPKVGKVILVGPTPYLHDTAPRCIESKNLGACAVDREEFDASADSSRKMLRSIAAKYRNVEYVEPADFFCQVQTCPVLKDGYSLYWDNNHVSSTAVRNFAVLYLQKRQSVPER